MSETNPIDPSTNDSNAETLPANIPTLQAGGTLSDADKAALELGGITTDPPPPPPTPVVSSGIVETHEQAAAINVERTAEDGYVNVGDQVPA